MRPWLLFVVGLAAFVTAAGGLQRLLPHRGTSLVEAKLAEMEREGGPWDVVFLGNSRVQQHVDPLRFDARLAEAGLKVRSYNLGAPNMSLPEIDSVCRRLDRRGIGPADWIFVDLGFRWGPWPTEFDTRRVIDWHDLRSTLLALRLAMIEDAETSERSSRRYQVTREDVLGRHIRAWANRAASRGRAAELLFGPSTTPSVDDVLEEGLRGFLPATRHADPEGVRRTNFLRQRDGWKRQVEEIRRDPGQGLREASPERLDHLTRIVRHLEARGHRVILFQPPGVEPSVPVPAELAADAVRFRFNDPDAYPDLHRPEAWWDRRHLNEEGAELFTDRLADRFLELRRETR